MEYFDKDGKTSFTLPRIPENANGEVVLGSFYRFLGLANTKEKDVGAKSREFRKAYQNKFADGSFKTPSGLNLDKFTYLIENLLVSPRLKNQGDTDIFYFSPIVPEVANLSCVARYNGNPWNPGAYLGEMLARGSNGSDVEGYLIEIRNELEVSSDLEQGDDAWASYLSSELKIWVGEKIVEPRKPKSTPIKLKGHYPAKRFYEDFIKLLKLKPLLPRRKWIALIESYLRLIISLDILWYCHVQIKLLSIIERSFEEELDNEEIDNILCDFNFFEVSMQQKSSVETYLKNYVLSSFSLNKLYQLGKDQMPEAFKNFTPNDIAFWVNGIKKIINKKDFIQIKNEINASVDQDPWAIKEYYAKKGSRTNNILEALKYIPSRRNTVDSVKSSYDQGYWFHLKGKSWIFQPGPAALTSIVQLCGYFFDSDVVSAKDMIEFLSYYGVVTDEKELSNGKMGQQLKRLNYVIDSPDFEGGILIRPPFKLLSS